uniref:Pre-SET domain-containing protein n=1 Tax=Panagrolaimus sp. ES5 TaxID=591445 RepID=A0AC34GBM5_9BILA
MASKRNENTKRQPEDRVVIKDITEGKELNFPIPVINNYNDELPKFDYVAHNSFTSGVAYQVKNEYGDVEPHQGCQCEFDHITQTWCGRDCQCETVSLVAFDPK